MICPLGFRSLRPCPQLTNHTTGTVKRDNMPSKPHLLFLYWRGMIRFFGRPLTRFKNTDVKFLNDDYLHEDDNFLVNVATQNDVLAVLFLCILHAFVPSSMDEVLVTTNQYYGSIWTCCMYPIYHIASLVS